MPFFAVLMYNLIVSFHFLIAKFLNEHIRVELAKLSMLDENRTKNDQQNTKLQTKRLLQFFEKKEADFLVFIEKPLV